MSPVLRASLVAPGRGSGAEAGPAGARGLGGHATNSGDVGHASPDASVEQEEGSGNDGIQRLPSGTVGPGRQRAARYGRARSQPAAETFK